MSEKRRRRTAVVGAYASFGEEGPQRERLRRAMRSLRESRIERGLSLAEAAELVGVEHNDLEAIEDGEGRLPVFLLDRYAEVLGKELIVSLRDKTLTPPASPAA